MLDRDIAELYGVQTKALKQVNIQIMRAFTRLRKMIVSHEDLKGKIETIEKKYDEQFQTIF